MSRGGRQVPCFGPVGLCWRMMARAPLRSAALFFLLLFISFLLSGAELLHRGISEAVDRGAKRLGADLMVVPAGADVRVGMGLFGGLPVRLSLPSGTERQVAAAPGVMAVAPQHFLVAAKSPCCDTGELLLVGFDPERDFTVLPWIRGEKVDVTGAGSVLAGGAVRKGVGAELRLFNHTFTVAARLEKSGLGYFDNTVFIPAAGLSAMERTSQQGGAVPFRIPRDRPSLLLVRLSSGVDPDRTAALLEGVIPGARVLTMPQLFREKRGVVERLDTWRTPLEWGGWLLAIFAGGVVQLPWWRERRPLLGLLRSCGMARGTMVGIFAMETLLLAGAAMAAGALLAALVAGLAAPLLVSTLGLPLAIDAGALYGGGAPRLWLLFSGAMTLETALLYWLLLRHEPAQLVRRG